MLSVLQHNVKRECVVRCCAVLMRCPYSPRVILDDYLYVKFIQIRFLQSLEVQDEALCLWRFHLVTVEVRDPCCTPYE